MAHGISCFPTWGVCTGMYSGNKVSQRVMHSQLHNLGSARSRNCVSVSPRTPSMLGQGEYTEHGIVCMEQELWGPLANRFRSVQQGEVMPGTRNLLNYLGLVTS